MKNSKVFSFFLLACVLLCFSEANLQAQNRKVKKGRKTEKVSKRVQATKPVRKTAYVSRVPASAVVVNHRNENYHYNRGVFYKPFNNRFVVVAPPLGIRVSNIPVGCMRLHFSGRTYFHYQNTFYNQIAPNQYEIVNLPVGATINNLPEGYTLFQLNGVTYYQFDNLYFRPVVAPNGAVIYEIVSVAA